MKSKAATMTSPASARGLFRITRSVVRNSMARASVLLEESLKNDSTNRLIEFRLVKTNPRVKDAVQQVYNEIRDYVDNSDKHRDSHNCIEIYRKN